MALPTPNATTTHSISISIRRQSDSPIYVGGTFSDPAWEPFELTAKPRAPDSASDNTSTEYVFSRDFDLPHGQYQYKFRDGKDGDWFFDHGVENETGSEGSAHNLLNVGQSQSASTEESTAGAETTVNGVNGDAGRKETHVAQTEPTEPDSAHEKPDADPALSAADKTQDPVAEPAVDDKDDKQTDKVPTDLADPLDAQRPTEESNLTSEEPKVDNRTETVTEPEKASQVTPVVSTEVQDAKSVEGEKTETREDVAERNELAGISQKTDFSQPEKPPEELPTASADESPKESAEPTVKEHAVDPSTDAVVEPPVAEKKVVEEPVTENPSNETSTQPAAEETAKETSEVSPVETPVVTKASTEELATEKPVESSTAGEGPTRESPDDSDKEAPAKESPVEASTTEEPAVESASETVKEGSNEPTSSAVDVPSAQDQPKEVPAEEKAAEPVIETTSTEPPEGCSTDSAAEKSTEKVTEEAPKETPVAPFEQPTAKETTADEPAEKPSVEATDGSALVNVPEDDGSKALTVDKSVESSAEKPLAEESPAAPVTEHGKPATETQSEEEPITQAKQADGPEKTPTVKESAAERADDVVVSMEQDNSAEESGTREPESQAQPPETADTKEDSTEKPAAETPVEVMPAVDTVNPSTEKPAVEAPVTEDPVPENTTAKELDTKETPAEIPAVEETERKLTDQPITESAAEPTSKEPEQVQTAEDPAAKEPSAEAEASSADKAAPGPATEESVPEASAAEKYESVAENRASEEAVQEQTSTEVPDQPTAETTAEQSAKKSDTGQTAPEPTVNGSAAGEHAAGDSIAKESVAADKEGDTRVGNDTVQPAEEPVAEATVNEPVEAVHDSAEKRATEEPVSQPVAETHAEKPNPDVKEPEPIPAETVPEPFPEKPTEEKSPEPTEAKEPEPEPATAEGYSANVPADVSAAKDVDGTDENIPAQKESTTTESAPIPEKDPVKGDTLESDTEKGNAASTGTATVPDSTEHGQKADSKDQEPAAEATTQANDVPEPAKEEAPKQEKQDESTLTPEMIAAGTAVVGAGAVAAGVAASSHQESLARAAQGEDNSKTPTEPKSETPVQGKSQTSRPEVPAVQVDDTPPAESKGQVLSQEETPEDKDKTPQPESQPDENKKGSHLTAEPQATETLAGDRDALLQKLQMPSAERLPSATSEQQGPKPAENATEAPAAESSRQPERPEAATLEPSKKDEDARPTSQNRSVTAVSLNSSKQDGWLKALLRAVFVNFFGAIFSPFRRRSRAQ